MKRHEKNGILSLSILFVLFFTLQSCGQKKYKYSDSEANQFLEEISKNIKT